MLIFWSLVRNSVVLAVYLLFSVACFLTVHEHLYNELSNKDWFMTLLDLKSYIQAKDKAFHDYLNRQNWAKMSLTNIANAGYFSSDRTIAEYNNDIWKLDK